MKDEIKEILDYLTKFINDKEEITKYGCEISVKQAKQLKDYIINLQEENENKDNKILELQQELLNKKLNVKDIEYKEKMIYKSRNKKAIEYIENDMPYLEEPDDDYENTHKMIEYDTSILLNILQGEEND